MNSYKINLDFPNLFPKCAHIYDGSFPDKDGIKRGRNSLFLNHNLFHNYLPELAELYPGAALKITKSTPNLLARTMIQRIFSWYGLAPKVLRQVLVYNNGVEYKAQVVEEAKGKHCFDIIEMRNLTNIMKRISDEHDIYQNDDLWPSNMIGGLWIDFCNFDFKKDSRYKTDTAIKYNRYCKWGNNSNGAYQSFPELGIKSGRSDIRAKMFGLDRYNFENKTVLDIGCSGGFMTNYCDKRGARAVGVDMAEVVEGARHATNATFHDTEFYPFDFGKDYFVETIRRITGIYKFDYVFFLSMDQHIGFKADYFEKLVRNTLFFESNGGKPVEDEYTEFKNELNKIFNQVKFCGVSEEGAKRNLFVCHKNEMKV